MKVARWKSQAHIWLNLERWQKPRPTFSRTWANETCYYTLETTRCVVYKDFTVWLKDQPSYLNVWTRWKRWEHMSRVMEKVRKSESYICLWLDMMHSFKRLLLSDQTILLVYNDACWDHLDEMRWEVGRLRRRERHGFYYIKREGQSGWGSYRRITHYSFNRLPKMDHYYLLTSAGCAGKKLSQFITCCLDATTLPKKNT